MEALRTISRRVPAMAVVAMAALVLGSLGATVAAQQRVEWTNVMNVAQRGSGLQKTGGCEGCDDAGATSRQMISGNGYAEFTVGESYTFWMAGLDHNPGSGHWNDLDFAIRFNGNDSADVLEHGQYRGGDTYYTAGDRFRIAVVNGRVQYLHNGKMMYESREAPGYPLMLKVVLGSMGASVRNAGIDTAGGRFTTRDRYGDRPYYPDYNDRAYYPSGVGTTGDIISVNPTEPWNDTGLWVEAGDVITFDASGQIQMSDNGSDVATPAGARSGRTAVNAPLRSQPAGLLIARIDNSAPMPIGARRTLRAPVSGELFLGVNDDYFQDNGGAYRVSVTIDYR
jgi:hypothetical protein